MGAMSAARQTVWWALGGVMFVGIAIVAAATSAWPGMVAALLLAAVQFTVAVVVRSSAPPKAAEPPTVDE